MDLSAHEEALLIQQLDESNDLFEWTAWSMTVDKDKPGIEITALDKFLRDELPAATKKISIKRYRFFEMLELRAEALYAYKNENINLMVAKCEALHAQAKLYNALPLAVLGVKTKKSRSVSGSAPRNGRTKEIEEIIAKRYRQIKKNSEYGEVKALAREYEVSIPTIRNIAKRRPEKE
jgi:hypothetical protein